MNFMLLFSWMPCSVSNVLLFSPIHRQSGCPDQPPLNYLVDSNPYAVIRSIIKLNASLHNWINCESFKKKSKSFDYLFCKLFLDKCRHPSPNTSASRIDCAVSLQTTATCFLPSKPNIPPLNVNKFRRLLFWEGYITNVVKQALIV